MLIDLYLGDISYRSSWSGQQERTHRFAKQPMGCCGWCVGILLNCCAGISAVWWQWPLCPLPPPLMVLCWSKTPLTWSTHVPNRGFAHQHTSIKRCTGCFKKMHVSRQNVQGTCSSPLTPAQTSDPEGRFLSNTPVLAHTFEYNPTPILLSNSDNDK